MITSLSHEKLYKDYKTKVMAYLSARVSCREDAEDLCVEVFLKLFRLMERYDEKRASVSTLVYKISHDIVIDYYRTHRDHEELSEEHAVSSGMEDALIDKERFAMLRDALEKLPQQQRDILILRFYEGWKLVKIAEEMGLTYDTVKGRQKAAFQAMRKMLEGKI